MKEKRNLPTISELVKDVGTYKEQDKLNYLLCQPVPKTWIKQHPFIKKKNSKGQYVPYEYLPIDKVEYLLRKIFKVFKIEILREGTAFNGVYVVVRVWYKDFIANEWRFHDGIGSVELQTKKGTSPADLSNINHGALSMAFPLAETLAVKDACDKFGDIFGANLNRLDTLPAQTPTEDTPLEQDTIFAFEQLTEAQQVVDLANSESYKHLENNINFKKLVQDKIKELNGK